MITGNMRLDAFLRHIRQDVPVLLFDLASKDNSKRLYPDAPTARCELESEGVEGCVIHWEYKVLMLRYEIVWVPVL